MDIAVHRIQANRNGPLPPPLPARNPKASSSSITSSTSALNTTSSSTTPSLSRHLPPPPPPVKPSTSTSAAAAQYQSSSLLGRIHPVLPAHTPPPPVPPPPRGYPSHDNVSDTADSGYTEDAGFNANNTHDHHHRPPLISRNSKERNSRTRFDNAYNRIKQVTRGNSNNNGGSGGGKRDSDPIPGTARAMPHSASADFYQSGVNSTSATSDKQQQNYHHHQYGGVGGSSNNNNMLKNSNYSLQNSSAGYLYAHAVNNNNTTGKSSSKGSQPDVRSGGGGSRGSGMKTSPSQQSMDSCIDRFHSDEGIAMGGMSRSFHADQVDMLDLVQGTAGTGRNSQGSNRNSQGSNRNSQGSNRNSQGSNRNSQGSNRNSGGGNGSIVKASIPEEEDSQGEPPPPPPEMAQKDLSLRLGILLGNRTPTDSQSETMSQSSSTTTNHREDYNNYGFPSAAAATASTNETDSYKMEYGEGYYSTNQNASPQQTTVAPADGYVSPRSAVARKDIKFASVSSLASEDAPEKTDSSPISTLTESSESGRGSSGLKMIYNPMFSPGSRDPSAESVSSLISTSTGNSMSPHGTITGRPHSITTTAPGPVEDIFGKRSSLRRSARAYMSARGTADSKGKSPAPFRRANTQRHTHGPLSPSPVRFAPIRPQQLHLTTINFEIPHQEANTIFIGREWLYVALEQELSQDPLCSSPRCRGAIIHGGIGFGKTAIIEQLIEFSCFGEGKGMLVQQDVPDPNKESPLQNGGSGNSATNSPLGSNTSLSASRRQISQSASSLQLTYDALKSLASHVVAYHICQADNNITCMVAEFVHSVAAYLVRAPQMDAYREHLLSDATLQGVLSMRHCIQDPSSAMVHGILEPLTQLKEEGKINADMCLILVDSLNEAEFHKPDYGDTIASFLTRHANAFPPWLKLVITVRTALLDLVAPLPFHKISLDHLVVNEYVSKDIQDYINYRINMTPEIRSNVALNGKLEARTQVKFTTHVQTLSRGCFLYCKLLLDLVHQGHLVLKSTNYKILPVNLSEIYLLLFNLKFPTIRSFEKVTPILNITLASLYPLTQIELFETLNSNFVHNFVSWEEYVLRMDILSGVLVMRQDGTYMFFHPAFREWLIRRDDNDSAKFLCDLRHGHALLAFRLSRVNAPLGADRSMELGHHILKAHIYKSVGKQLGYSSRDMQAYWMASTSLSLSAALVSQHNLFSPNVKVSRLMLLSGANPNCRTPYLHNAPLLTVAAHEGFEDVVAMLLDFSAAVNQEADDGMSALCHAAQQGHVGCMKLLVARKAKITIVDCHGRCALVHAAEHGQLDAVSVLLQCDWAAGQATTATNTNTATRNSDKRSTMPPPALTRNEALQQALIAAAMFGHRHVAEFLLQLKNVAGVGFDVNLQDSLRGETALTAACMTGELDMIACLLAHGAVVHTPNTAGSPPLHMAARHGQTDAAEMLLEAGQAGGGGVGGASMIDSKDTHGRTALMGAAEEGREDVVELLLGKGAQVDAEDIDGFTALLHAARHAHTVCARLLVRQGANVEHTERRHGRTALDLAASSVVRVSSPSRELSDGAAVTVQFLLDEAGADLEHADTSGLRALDAAISANNASAVRCFLRKGAKLGPATWAMATDKPGILLLLLNKLLEDGNILYRKNRIKDAAHRYTYALRKFPHTEDIADPVVVDVDAVEEGVQAGGGRATFTELRVNLLLNLSRCKRKLNDTPSAVELATRALELKPKSFEAYYARARAKRDDRQFAAALQDITEAHRLAPDNRELRRLLARVQEECKEQAKMEIVGSVNSSPVVGNPDKTGSVNVPDLVSSMSAGGGGGITEQRLREETAL